MRALSRGLSAVVASVALTGAVAFAATPANAIFVVNTSANISGPVDGFSYGSAPVPVASCLTYQGATGTVTTVLTYSFVDESNATLLDNEYTVTCTWDGVTVIPFMPMGPPMLIPFHYVETLTYWTTESIIPIAPASVSVPADMTLVAESVHGAAAYYALSGNGSFSCDLPSGSVFPIGVTQVHCFASTQNASATGQFTITVTDPAQLTIAVPKKITMSTRAKAGVRVTFSTEANDSLDGALAVSCDHASGSLFRKGVTHVTCTATNSRGHAITAAFDVVVKARRR